VFCFYRLVIDLSGPKPVHVFLPDYPDTGLPSRLVRLKQVHSPP
jgi:hypothetical protein